MSNKVHKIIHTCTEISYSLFRQLKTKKIDRCLHETYNFFKKTTIDIPAKTISRLPKPNIVGKMTKT